MCTQQTQDWRNYKVDVLFHIRPLPGGGRGFSVEVSPSASAMVLRASSYIPPDVSDRGLILATLVKGKTPLLFLPSFILSRLTSCFRRLWVQATISRREKTQVYDAQALLSVIYVSVTSVRCALVNHEADIMMGSVYAIAKQQRLWKRSQAKEFKGTVKEVIGTCHSLGITIDGAHHMHTKCTRVPV
jgi:ribosomal protein L11